MNPNPNQDDTRQAREWIEYVESVDPEGSRQKEIYPLIRKWLQKIQPKIVVDIGAGQGICSMLANSDMNYIGIDPSEILINRAKELYSATNRKFIIGDTYKVPLENECTDAIISIAVWSHLENITQAA